MKRDGFAQVPGARLAWWTDWTDGSDGAGDGIPLVLVHAGVADARMWEPVVPALGATHRVVRFDMRGFGRSRSGRGAFSPAGDITALLDALSSAVALNVDLDTTLTVWAAATYDALRCQLPGYEGATPDTIWRRFISTSGQITIGPDHVTCRLNSRTYSPVMRTASLPNTDIPWWNGRPLRLEFA